MMIDWIINTVQSMGHTNFPIGTILFYAAVIAAGTSFTIFVVLIKIIPVFRREEDKIYTDARKTQTTANGQKCEFELHRASVLNEMSLYGTLMFCFICIACFVSYFFGATNMLLMAITSGILWIIIYTSIGWTEVPAKDFLIIEEFGNFKRVLLSGPHVLCFPGLIDEKKDMIHGLRTEHLQFFKGESGNKVLDFKGGFSASTKMTAWYQIINPILWMYQVENPLTWLEDHIFRAAQKQLEEEELQYAIEHKKSIAQKTLTTNPLNGTTKNSLRNQVSATLGIKLTDFIINDISLPKKIKNIRMERQRGIANRDKRVEKSKGYADAIQAIIERGKNSGRNITYAQAKELYDENQNREMATGSNITIIGGDIQSMVKTLVGG